jgi:hypothetical protein
MRAWLDRNQHLVKAYFWVAFAVPTCLWWSQSVLLVLLISLYANYAAEKAADEAHKGRLEHRESADGRS